MRKSIEETSKTANRDLGVTQTYKSPNMSQHQTSANTQDKTTGAGLTQRSQMEVQTWTHENDKKVELINTVKNTNENWTDTINGNIMKMNDKMNHFKADMLLRPIL